jgi:hypothetical protein
VVFGSGSNVALRVSVLPLPQSRYLITATDVSAPSYRPLPPPGQSEVNQRMWTVPPMKAWRGVTSG